MLFLSEQIVKLVDVSSYEQKGTIVEKLEEETAKDGLHLRHLIGICEGLIWNF